MTEMTSALLKLMIAASRAAGDEIERIYGAGCATEWKPDGSPVTEADRAAEAIILRHLRGAYPDLPVLAEEEACAGQVPELGERWFLVDPLDGTRGFVERNGEFTVNVALIECGEPVAGVVYAPDRHLLYAGERGAGAFRSRDGEEPEAIGTRAPPVAGLVAIASRSQSDATRERIARLPVAAFVPSSSSLKFCLLAEGSADLYPRYSRTMEWDTGAGQAILEAAGGRVLALEGDREAGRLRYGKAEAGFANPHFIAWGR
jgi:3'(2'), 5'-bisphosphate nucleotidase